jgi:flagellar hook-associated protein 3 FlgL
MPVNSTVTTSRNYLTMQMTSLSKTLSEKTTQLATGKVSNTYGGLGDNRLLDLELTQKVTQIDSYRETITRANLHIDAMNLSLERLEALRLDAKASFDANSFELQSDGTDTNSGDSRGAAL